VGVRFIVAAFARSTGGVVTDPSLPVEDVSAAVNSPVIGAGMTFALSGKTALATAVVPYAWASATGRVQEESRKATRSGLADPRFKLSVNLVGGDALSPREFAATPRSRNLLGVSLTVAPPIGQYFPDKLINLGANRWSFKPEIGYSRARNRWTLEGYLGTWLFTGNDSFYPGESKRTQDPILSLQAHASYTIKPRLWLAADGTWYVGGTTTVDGVDKADLQRNSRLGTTLSLPLVDGQSLKLSYSTGATTRVGGDFDTFGVAWQYSWSAN
jgi:hypothetical protein